MQKNANNTNTEYSFLAFDEFFNDNYTTDGPRLTSQQQKKLLSQSKTQHNFQKEKNEKQG